MFGGKAPPGPAGGAYALPQTPSHNGEEATSKGKRGSLLLKGMEKREGTEREINSPSKSR